MLVAAACDGDDDALTKEDWIRAANAICGDANEAFNALFEEGFPTTPERSQEFVADVVPIVEDEVNELQELEAPEDDADTIDDALARGEAAVDDLREASESPDAAGAIFQEEGGENLVAFEDGLVEFGAERCELGEEEGDGEEGEVEEPDPSTFSAEKRAFIEEADAICQAANDVISPAEDEAFGEGTPTLEEWEEFLTLVIETNAPAQAQLEALEPPAEDAEAAEAIFRRFASLLDDVTVARDAAAEGDQEAFDQAFGDLIPQFEEIDRQARQYGFQVCGVEEDDEEDDGGGEDGEGGGGPEEGGEE